MAATHCKTAEYEKPMKHILRMYGMPLLSSSASPLQQINERGKNIFSLKQKTRKNRKRKEKMNMW